MKVTITPNYVKLELTADDTRRWAQREGDRWPVSTLSGHTLIAEFGKEGLVDIGGDAALNEISNAEFDAITSGFLAASLAPGHPAYYAVVGHADR